MPVLMTQAEFAERHKVGKPAVTAWKKKGLLVFADDPERPGKQLVDAEKSDLLVRGSIDPTRGRPRTAERAEIEAEGVPPTIPATAASPRGLSGLEEARLEDMRERTRARRIETERQLGTLVAISEYERRAGDLGRLVRERTHALVRQLADRIAAETDPRQVMAVLDEAFDQLFAQVADEIEAEATKERQVDAELAPLAADDAEDGDVEDPDDDGQAAA